MIAVMVMRTMDHTGTFEVGCGELEAL